VRRLIVWTLTVVTLTLSACSPPAHRQLEAYHDPAGLFSAELPGANEVTVIPPSTVGGGVEMLSGVTSAPEAAASAPVGRQFQFSRPDQAMFLVYVFRGEALTASEALAGMLLGANSGFVADDETTAPFAHTQGILRVGHVERPEQGSIGLAAAFLVENGTGYAVLEVFPENQWPSQRDDFLKVLASFRTGTPPGVATVPLSPAA
jgi:hypothetical protein